MSLRKIRRWLRKRASEQQIRPRRAEVLAAIAKDLNLPTLPTFKVAGEGGHDGIYYLSHEGKPLGVLRLVNPFKKRIPPGDEMPFALEDSSKRIARERDAYTVGAAFNLTPKPLWHCDDALMCEWLPYTPLHKALLANPHNAWPMLARATDAVGALHKTGITHMDVSLANIIADADMQHLVFVDFEYSPSPQLSLAEQKLYDHLRLVESTWKFIPAGERGNWQAWFNTFEKHVDADMRKVNIEKLEPALGRLLKADGLGDALRNLFAR